MDEVKNILVAEDNESNFLLVKAILREHNITRAVNGVEAVRLAAENDYDVIFMDIRMPMMDGLEATRNIRESGNDVVIIALTANAFDSDRTAAFEAGCNAFISKPLKGSVLKQVLGGGGGRPLNSANKETSMNGMTGCSILRSCGD